MVTERRFGIAGSGAYLPQRVVTAADLDRLTGSPDGHVAHHYGIVQRHWALPHETSSWMGEQAARAALDDAGWDAASLDLIVGACGVMEQPIPGTSVLIQRRLGLGSSGIAAYDINATCLSFLQALDHVLARFALGEAKRALIVCADIASAALDFSDAESSVLFGDGAAAIALEADGPHVRLVHRFQTWGDAADACRLEAGGTRLRPHDNLDTFLARSRFAMDGPAVFRATSRRFPRFIADLLAAADVAADTIDSILPHQASAAALEHLKRSLPGGHGKVVDLFATTGNQIATSLATTLHHARQSGLIASGSTSLLIGSSAGISLGGALVRW